MNKNVNLKQLANQLMFDIKDDETNMLEEDFNTFLKQVSLLNEIDTSNVEPMIYPIDDSTSFLRDDDSLHILDKSDVLVNAKRVEDGYFVIPKVVK